MTLVETARDRIKNGRRRGAFWARAFDVARLLGSAAGRAQLLTLLRHADAVHQTTSYTSANRYPAVFDRAAELMPDPARILSFGCSTGEELLALRSRFPSAEIVGAEINARSRRIAARRTEFDRRIQVVPPAEIGGVFDLIFALAVLQREPHKVADAAVHDLGSIYPFQRFDDAVMDLVRRLAPDGILCIWNAHYRVEDSSAATLLGPASDMLRTEDDLFGMDSRRIQADAHVFFRKHAA